MALGRHNSFAILSLQVRQSTLPGHAHRISFPIASDRLLLIFFALDFVRQKK